MKKVMHEIDPIYVKKPWGSLNTVNIINGKQETDIGEIFLYSPSLIPDNIKNILPFKAPNILLKYIFAKDWLSIQVHPNNIQAQELENQLNGKSEAWYFLSEGTVISGLSESFKNKKGILTNSYDQNDYVFTQVKETQFMSIPAGTVHAIGPGIKLFEIQQPSDITYRVYDWDENKVRNRELHLDKANKVMTTYNAQPSDSNMLSTPYFKCYEKEFDHDVFSNDQPCILINVSDLTKKAILLQPHCDILLDGKFIVCEE